MTRTRQKERTSVLTSCRLQSARRRAALLVVVWTMSGFWQVGHALAHELDHNEHFASTVEDLPALSMAENHDHGHDHPEPSPIVSTGKGPEFDSPGVLPSLPEVACQVTTRASFSRAAPARASPRHTGAARPRAPPLS